MRIIKSPKWSLRRFIARLFEPKITDRNEAQRLAERRARAEQAREQKNAAKERKEQRQRIIADIENQIKLGRNPILVLAGLYTPKEIIEEVQKAYALNGWVVDYIPTSGLLKLS